MKYSNIPAAQLLVQSCKTAGIKNIIISPGSRNAPLTLSFTGDPFFNCFSIVDERCAAFFGLGIAQQKEEPVAVVCTSGSALLNYYPAIAEAFYSNIPLVAISADRPPYKIDVGDGQTIRQDNVFDRHIGYSANLKIDAIHSKERLSFYQPELLEKPQESIAEFNQDQITTAFRVAFAQKLPVHINIPFEEPLYGLEEVDDEKGISWELNMDEEVGIESNLQAIYQIWNSAKRKLILVGVNPPNSVEKQYLEWLANDPSVIVFTETTSNLHHPNFFPSIDSIIFPIEKSKDAHEHFLELQPDVLLTFGGLVVSKKVKAFLRKYKPKHHWHIHPTKAYDTYFSLTRHFKQEPNYFLGRLFSNSQSIESAYFNRWHSVKKNYQAKQLEYTRTTPFTDFTVFEVLQETIPKGYQVHLSNSSTVRYAQLFPLHDSIPVYCNRGTSGIDGSTSTAIGGSIYHISPTILISGDLSFFYDSNALWNNYIKNDFRIILINNAGGGIFRILPGFDGSDRFATFFETEHHLTAKNICAQFGIGYQSATDRNSLKEALFGFFEIGKRPKLIEVFTPRELNNEILLGYFDFISSEYR